MAHFEALVALKKASEDDLTALFILLADQMLAASDGLSGVVQRLDERDAINRMFFEFMHRAWIARDTQNGDARYAGVLHGLGREFNRMLDRYFQLCNGEPLGFLPLTTEIMRRAERFREDAPELRDDPFHYYPLMEPLASKQKRDPQWDDLHFSEKMDLVQRSLRFYRKALQGEVARNEFVDFEAFFERIGEQDVAFMSQEMVGPPRHVMRFEDVPEGALLMLMRDFCLLRMDQLTKGKPGRHWDVTSLVDGEDRVVRHTPRSLVDGYLRFYERLAEAIGQLPQGDSDEVYLARTKLKTDLLKEFMDALRRDPELSLLKRGVIHRLLEAGMHASAIAGFSLIILASRAFGVDVPLLEGGMATGVGTVAGAQAADILSRAAHGLGATVHFTEMELRETVAPDLTDLALLEVRGGGKRKRTHGTLQADGVISDELVRRLYDGVGDTPKTEEQRWR